MVGERYVELLKRSILGALDEDNQLRVWYLRRCLTERAFYDPRTLYAIRQHAPDAAARFLGSNEKGMPYEWDLDQLPFTLSMSGRARVESLEQCVRDVIRDEVPGDFIECGVWRGGMAILMRGLLEVLGDGGRTVWVADSFEGLPAPRAEPDNASGVDLSKQVVPSLAVDAETVRRNFANHGLLDDRVRFLEGWFADTLPAAPIDQLALLRADGDMYSSTVDILSSLYDKVSPGGVIIIDDYALPACRVAVDEFLQQRGLRPTLVEVDWACVYWRKGA